MQKVFEIIERKWDFKKIAVPLIFLFTFSLLSIHCNWGIPNQKRLELVGGKDFISSKLPDIWEAREKFQSGQELNYEEAIDYSLVQFLLNSWAGDEGYVLLAIKNLNPYELKFDPKFYIYGGGLIYTGAVFIQLASWLGFVTINTDPNFYMENPEEFGKIYLVLRLMNILFATIGLFLFYLMVNEFYGQRIAFFSWLIVMTVPVTHQTAHTVEPHIFVLPFVMVSFWYSFKSIKPSSLDVKKRNYIIAAIFAGISIGTQATSLYIVIPFLVSLMINYFKNEINKIEMVKYFLTYGGASLAALFLLNPFYIFNYSGFMADIKYGTGNQHFVGFHNFAVYQLTGIILSLFVLSIVYHLFKYRKNENSIMLLSCAISALAVFFAAGNCMQYIYPSLSVFAVLTAIMLQDTLSLLGGKNRYIFIIMLFFLFMTYPISRSAYYIINYTSENRESAGGWINDNVPKNSTVGIKFRPQIWDCVPFAFHNYKLIDYDEGNFRNENELPYALVYLSRDIPDNLRRNYVLKKVYTPNKIFGRDFVLKGEIHALIAKTIRIYIKKE